MSNEKRAFLCTSFFMSVICIYNYFFFVEFGFLIKFMTYIKLTITVNSSQLKEGLWVKNLVSGCGILKTLMYSYSPALGTFGHIMKEIEIYGMHVLISLISMYLLNQFFVFCIIYRRIVCVHMCMWKYVSHG